MKVGVSSPVALSRSCSFTDFPGCVTAGDWQQALADQVYLRWVATAPVGEVVVVNWSPHPFSGPMGTTYADGMPFYQTQADPPFAGLLLLGVLDRLAAPVQTLKAILPRLAPGGLLFATVAYWNAQGADCASGHETRRRIYNREALTRLIQDDLRKEGLATLGPIDWTYRGHALGDHTLHSVVLMKGA